MQFVCALVVVEDIKKSRVLYEEILDQTVTADFGQNITFAGGFALHEENHFKTLIGNKDIRKNSNSFELYFEEEDIQTIFDKIKDHGFEFVHEIREQPWRQRVLRFYDYDQNIIEIGKPMSRVAYRLHCEGVPIKNICEITYLDENTIEESIAKYSS